MKTGQVMQVFHSRDIKPPNKYLLKKGKSEGNKIFVKSRNEILLNSHYFPLIPLFNMSKHRTLQLGPKFVQY